MIKKFKNEKSNANILNNKWQNRRTQPVIIMPRSTIKMVSVSSLTKDIELLKAYVFSSFFLVQSTIRQEQKICIQTRSIN